MKLYVFGIILLLKTDNKGDGTIINGKMMSGVLAYVRSLLGFRGDENPATRLSFKRDRYDMFTTLWFSYGGKVDEKLCSCVLLKPEICLKYL